MKRKVTIYKKHNAESMFDWRKKDGDPYENLMRHTRQLLFLHKYKDMRKKLRVLDYGCAFGDVPAMMKVFNNAHELYGVEIIKEVARAAEERFGNGAVFIQSCESRVPLKSDSLDLIFSFDMVEHVADKDDIRRMLKECNRLLKKDGRCIIVTPNGNWILKLVYVITGNSWMVNKKGHPNLYTLSRLKKEMTEELKIIGAEKGYDLNLFTRLLSWLGIYKHICIISGKKIK